MCTYLFITLIGTQIEDRTTTFNDTNTKFRWIPLRR